MKPLRDYLVMAEIAVVVLLIGTGVWSAVKFVRDTRATITVLRTMQQIAEQRSANALQLAGEKQAQKDSLARELATEREHATALSRSANALRAERERLSSVRVSESPVALESPSAASADELARTTRARDLAVAETDTLRAELSARDQLEAMQVQQVTLLQTAVDSVTAALVGSRALTQQQAAAMARMEPRCHLVFSVPCPSRKVAFVGGVAAVVITHVALIR